LSEGDKLFEIPLRYTPGGRGGKAREGESKDVTGLSGGGGRR